MTVFNSEEVDTKKQPMFFGKPLGIQRYDSYKYPIFDKLTTQQLGYFWRPEEVSLQKDRSSGDLKKYLFKKIAATIICCVQNKNISSLAI
jgi:ribonucleotide reductase beta subunit family protein with ferritin-like domain